MTELGGGFDIYAHLRERPSPQMVCPHCRGVGGVEPHPELVLVCKLCGAPRITMPDGMPNDPSSFAQLQKADRARKKRGFLGGLGVIGGVGAAFGVFVALLTLLFGGFAWSMVPFILFVVPSIAALLYARSARTSATKEVAASIDAAWMAAAADLVRAGKVRNAQDLVRATGVDPARAQQVMTMLSVDADIGAPHVRIDAGPVVAQVPADPRFAALEAREREAETEASAVLDDARAKNRTN
ncbi:MAG: hypothetical protein HOW73_13465 [Polyangiaceae bacterium]|nr:hypothetical protein [Polyangiaceae bacterium]